MTVEQIHMNAMRSLARDLDAIARGSSLTAPEFCAALLALASNDAILRTQLQRGERSSRPPAIEQPTLPEMRSAPPDTDALEAS